MITRNITDDEPYSVVSEDASQQLYLEVNITKNPELLFKLHYLFMIDKLKAMTDK